MKHLILTALLTVLGLSSGRAAEDYKESAAYLTLRDSVHYAFNSGDSTRFFNSVKQLEDYLLAQNDLHAYYTQRCNEIVFLMNRNKIFEAYKLARQLSHELRERQLDKEMYMAVNMMGHIYRYCGKKESARKCFEEVIQRMEQAGYRESMPPIYMNIVNVLMDDDPEEALRMLDKAAEIASETSPERVFDIETRRTLAAYSMGDKARFMEGYKHYREGVDSGLSSVHGRSMEIYYQAALGNIDEAVKMARQEMGEDGYGTIAKLYKDAGRWREAYEALQQETAANDSINTEILSNNMDGIQDELLVYEAERQVARNRIITLLAISALLVLIIALLTLLVLSRRRHMKQLKRAYEHALESDKVKTAFIQNVSHEVRTPLNIISGFAQIISDPNLDAGIEERQNIAKMMQKNTRLITSLIDEMLELSVNESTGAVAREDKVAVNELLRTLLHDNEASLAPGVSMALDTALDDDYQLLTSELMLKRIVNALLDNAVKNTSEGHITLKATADEQTITLTVEDTGCGIPAAEADRIFERFVKLDTFKEGIGLGLTLCRTLAGRLGGSVALDTDYVGPGARFVVKLPI